mmetsp:Transcript_19731/g.39282  ORF Transcript_19731/g.39282 Transcript_19731/m.39282 type:complete len:209 (-) Transcript_19731:286-912(-)
MELVPAYFSGVDEIKRHPSRVHVHLFDEVPIVERVHPCELIALCGNVERHPHSMSCDGHVVGSDLVDDPSILHHALRPHNDCVDILHGAGHRRIKHHSHRHANFRVGGRRFRPAPVWSSFRDHYLKPRTASRGLGKECPHSSAVTVRHDLCAVVDKGSTQAGDPVPRCHRQSGESFPPFCDGCDDGIEVRKLQKCACNVSQEEVATGS